jgi:hypothetical protein
MHAPPHSSQVCWGVILFFVLQLMVPAESAHDTIGALGEVGLLQFKDLNADKSAFQRTYANQVGDQHFETSQGACIALPGHVGESGAVC